MTARIQPNPNTDLKAKIQLMGVKQLLGSTPNLFTTLAHSSAVLDFYLSGLQELNNATLPVELREQIAIAVAGENSCDYCAAAHTALAKMLKIDETELTLNLSGKSNDTKTQAALLFAQKIVDARGRLVDGDLAAIRVAGYNDAEIVEIIAVVCQNIFTNYFNHIAETEVDFPKVASM